MDYVTAYAECMEEKGWSVEITEDVTGGYGVTVGYPSEQESQYQEDSESCNSMFTVAEMDSELAHESYEEDKEIGECLVAEGYSVPELPSEQTYVADLLADTLTYEVYSLVPDDDLVEALTVCNSNG